MSFPFRSVPLALAYWAATLLAGKAAAPVDSVTIPLPQPTWGRLIQPTNSTGKILLEIRTWPADGKLPLPTPFPNVTAAHILDGIKREPLRWEFNTDATRLNLELPTQAPAALP